MITILLSVPLLLLAAGLAVALRSNRAAAAVSIAAQVAASLLVIAGVAAPIASGVQLEVIWPWSAPIDPIAFRVDALGGFFLAWSLPMTTLGTVYALGYLQPYHSRGRHGGPHYALLNLISVSFVLVYTAQNALVFLIGWELAAVAAWLLVIWDYENQKVRFAGFNYLVSTHVGLFVLGSAFMLLHGQSGSMDFATFAPILSAQGPARGTLFLLLGVAFALKAAFFPLHTWLPRAHAAAPAHVSALMSGVIHKAGLFAFLRFTGLMGQPDEWMGWCVLGFGACSAFFGALYTTTQRDLKRLLGYSSTENVGVAAMGFGVGYLGWAWGVPLLSACGFAGGLLHVFNHALFKCLLFYAAGAVYRATHSVDLERLGGLARQMPKTAALYLIGGLSISALPPLNGFVSEVVIQRGLLSGAAPSASHDVALVAAAAVLGFVGAVSALAMTRAFGVVFLGSPRDATLGAAHDPPLSMRLPMTLHATGALALGVLPELGVGLTRQAVALFVSPAHLDAALRPLGAMLWATRILLGLLLGAGIWRWLGAKNARRTPTWGCGYGAPSPRMQYTGSSFSQSFARVFESFLPALRRERLPRELFPEHPAELATHHPDAVERRLFEALGRGEEFVTGLARRIPEEPRHAFAAALCCLVLMAALVGMTELR